MANPPLNQDLSLQLRVAVNNAYAYVKGQESTQSFLAVTFEDLAAAQVQRLSGKGTTTRPNFIDRIKKVEADIVSAAKQIKQLPPEAFLPPDDQRDVNTPP
jgi:hypothetical protein